MMKADTISDFTDNTLKKRWHLRLSRMGKRSKVTSVTSYRSAVLLHNHASAQLVNQSATPGENSGCSCSSGSGSIIRTLSAVQISHLHLKCLLFILVRVRTPNKHNNYLWELHLMQWERITYSHMWDFCTTIGCSWKCSANICECITS